MSQMITQRELRNSSGQVMRMLEAGHTFIVTRNGQPVGELRPLRRHRFVDVQMVREVFKGAPTIDSNAFRRDIDEALDQSIDPYA